MTPKARHDLLKRSRRTSKKESHGRGTPSPGRAKHKVAIGFYPWNARGQSRWAAIDFDAHDGGAARAKAFALAAFQILRRHPEFHLILATSGSEGWHLFVFSAEFHPVENWVRLLKQVADQIGAEIKTGICEIFPNETRNRLSTACDQSARHLESKNKSARRNFL